MSLSPTPSSSSSSTTTTSTTPQQPDYLSLLNGLSPLPFDPNTVINALLAADQVPITNLQSQINNIQTGESIYQSIASDVSNVQSLAFNLTLQSNTHANTASSSFPSAMTVTAAPTASAGSYSVAINSLATATTATSTAGIGRFIDGVASTTPLNALNLRGTPTGGTFSVVVDGKVQTVSVDSTMPLIDSVGTNPPQGALSQLQAAIKAGVNDANAVVNVGVSNDKVAITISGATTSHTISFGASGDSSNVLSLLGLDTVQGTSTGGTLALNSTATVGVAQVNASLSSTPLTTALSAGSGSFSINGIAISWNASTDTLADVINRINTSGAGVAAQYNSVTDQLVLTNKATGQLAMNLSDTGGNFLAAMNLAPGTSTAQKLGSNASVTVNGTTVSSTSNTITNAAPGLSITALAPTTGTGATVTVGTDTAGITKRVQDFVDAVNKTLGDIGLTQQKDATTGKYSQLFGDQTLLGLKNWLLTTVTGAITQSGSYQSLQDIGVTTGSTGSTPGTTNSLTLDTTKLAAALTANPSAVAALFNGTTAANGFQGVARTLSSYLLQQTNPLTGSFSVYQAAGDARIKEMQTHITRLQTGITQHRAVLQAQFTAMSNALSLLNSQASIFNSSSASSSSGH